MNNNTLPETKTLNDLLEDYSVMFPGQWENELSNTTLKDWYAVANDNGIIAYFAEEKDAFGYRLDRINTILNRQ
jgi:hypothetical protein